jgi:peptidoglycan/xylan/chitin deacetylase (PgdA/CDA1 family)
MARDRVARRRQIRRRRACALAAVVAVAAAAVGTIVAASGSSTKRAEVPRTRVPARAGVRASTPRVLAVHDAAVPILMYHVIARAPAGAPNPGLFVPPSLFRAQLAWLARNGYHAVSLRRVYDYWTRGRPLPRRPVVVSFDDGYLADLREAMPALRTHGWSGVLNLELNNVRPGDLTAFQVRELIRAGWEIDAHTITHPDLRAVGAAQLQREVAGSRSQIRQRFGVPVDFFCYPAGKYDARVVTAVRAAGYRAATTVDFGLASPRDGLFTLKRVRIDPGDGVSGFAAKLRGTTAGASSSSSGAG